METTNYYEEKSKRKSRSENIGEDFIRKNENDRINGNFTDVIKNVMTDTGLSVLGGGFTSAVLGRLSLPFGMLITGYGHYKKNDALRVLGIGIMASSSMTNRMSKNPKAGILENITERVHAFGEELKSKLSIDLLTKQAEGTKENKSTSDLNGTEIKQTPEFHTVSKAKDIKTVQPPDAHLFENPMAEYLTPKPMASVKEGDQRNYQGTKNDYLNDLPSIEERLL